MLVYRFQTIISLGAYMLLAIMPCIAQGDIYQQVDADGVLCFTDTPSSAGYSLLLKEQHSAHKGATQRKLPRHLGAVELAAQTVPPATSLSITAPSGKGLPVQGRITSVMGVRNDPFDGKLRHHNGMDIACPSGTPIKPVSPGTVIFSGSRPGYGNIVVIEHPDGTVTLYAHNLRNTAVVGEQVDQSSIIALTGSTGRSTGPHLHFEAWRNGENVTPAYLPSGGVATTGHRVAEAPIKRYLQADGTLVFTNLP
jgi:murein DD-endopeptidase MepM/ murein hydrolase activator NlpD